MKNKLILTLVAATSLIAAGILAVPQPAQAAGCQNQVSRSDGVINTNNKRVTLGTVLRPGDQVRVEAEETDTIDLSPGQWWPGSGRNGPAGNGRPAGSNWKMQGQSEFAVWASFNDTGQRFMVHAKSDCVQYAGDGGAPNRPTWTYVALNTNNPPFSYDDNTWDGQIRVRVRVFR